MFYNHFCQIWPVVSESQTRHSAPLKMSLQNMEKVSKSKKSIYQKYFNWLQWLVICTTIQYKTGMILIGFSHEEKLL